MSGQHSLLGLRQRSNPLSVVRFYGYHSHDGVGKGSSGGNVSIAARGCKAKGLHAVLLLWLLLLLLFSV